MDRCRKLFIVTFLCMVAGASIAKAEVAVAFVGALTGVGAIPSSVSGLQFGIDVLNDQGGLLGEKLHVEFYDDRCEADEGGAVAKRALAACRIEAENRPVTQYSNSEVGFNVHKCRKIPTVLMIIARKLSIRQAASGSSGSDSGPPMFGAIHSSSSALCGRSCDTDHHPIDEPHIDPDEHKIGVPDDWTGQSAKCRRSVAHRPALAA